MSLRIIALCTVVAGLSVYAWKDWFKSLCGLILLMAIIRHEDMPNAVFGVQGLNPWNMLFLMIALAWAVSRHREGLTWDMPRHVTALLVAYLGVIVIGALRAVFDRSHLDGYPLQSLISEEMINTVKWVLPALLLFDGCRTRNRVLMAVGCLLVMYSLVAVQVVRRLPPSAVFSAGSSLYGTRRACADIGYSACDISTMLAGVSWAILAALPLIRGRKGRWLGLAGAAVVFYGQALTGGRAGYLAWAGIGLTLCLLKWRKYLIIAPVVVILVPVVFPGATARMLEGFGQIDVTGEAGIDTNAATSDRILFWPYIIRKIGDSPWIGHGRLAMQRTGLVQVLEEEYPGIGATQPHNMYLESLLDNGVLGSLPLFAFWAMMILYGARLFKNDNRLYSAIGGLVLSLTLAQLFAGVGSQHFYPEESTLGMWVAMFLSLRVYVEKQRAHMAGVGAETAWNPPPVSTMKKLVVSRTS